MKVESKKRTNMVIGAMVFVAVIAAAFWILALSPKREEASKLDTQVKKLESSLAQHKSEILTAKEAQREFPSEYQRLVVLGKAVPADDETPSLLVQLNRIARRSHVSFQTLKLESSGAEETETSGPPTNANGEPVSATEAAASLMPLGAKIGPAGLAVMPYSLTFTGSFFKMADFIDGLDSLVKSNNDKVGVNGRLITINGFSLSEDPEAGFPDLLATFSVTTYLTPPSGETAGASPEGPAEPPTSVPASTTTGGAP